MISNNQLPPLNEALSLCPSVTQTLQDKTWYPLNVIFKHYKKKEQFVQFGICKDTNESFQFGMEQIAQENNIRIEHGVDFHFFKKKGKVLFVVGDPSLKSTVIAFTSAWIQKCILGCVNTTEMDPQPSANPPVNKKSLHIAIPPTHERLELHELESPHSRNEIWYPWNVIYKRYKNTEQFMNFNINKECKHRFVQQMTLLADGHGIKTETGVDFQFFKKKGKDKYVACDSGLKTATVAFSENWINHCIVHVTETEPPSRSHTPPPQHVEEVESVPVEVESVPDEVESELEELESVHDELESQTEELKSPQESQSSEENPPVEDNPIIEKEFHVQPQEDARAGVADGTGDEEDCKLESDDEIDDDEYEAVKVVNAAVKKENQRKRKKLMSQFRFNPKTFVNMGTQTPCWEKYLNIEPPLPGPSSGEPSYVPLKMIPAAELHSCDINQDRWFSMSMIRKYYATSQLFFTHEVTFMDDQSCIDSMCRINDHTDATLDEGIDYTWSDGELVFTKNWIRYVIVDHLKHPSSTIPDDEYELVVG